MRALRKGEDGEDRRLEVGGTEDLIYEAIEYAAKEEIFKSVVEDMKNEEEARKKTRMGRWREEAKLRRKRSEREEVEIIVSPTS